MRVCAKSSKGIIGIGKVDVHQIQNADFIAVLFQYLRTIAVQLAFGVGDNVTAEHL